MENIVNIAKNAKDAYLKMMNLSSELKNEALIKIAQKLEEKKEEIFEANKKDLEYAKELLEKNEINLATYNRLKLDENKMRDMISGLYDLSKLEDITNRIVWEKELDKNLILKKIITPIGVIGVIFEARPDCLVQIASLIIKSANAVILKGGRECENTNRKVFEVLSCALKEVNGFPDNVVNLVYSRDDIKNLLALDEYVNLIIPRGSNKLVKYIKENTKIPVLGHASGICHIFLDENFEFENAKKIINDAKTQYPSACNAVETLLIHKNFKYKNELINYLKAEGIEIIENPETFEKEYGDKILSLKIVDNLDCAIEHINKFGSGHTDSILSNDKEHIEKFLNLVDSACVFSNCSTRFSDGFRFGFGAEVGISTNKTHARGPVGLEGLTIYKYKLYGSNDIVSSYASGEKHFTHKFI